MKDKLIIIGAGGHGRVAADIAALVGYGEVSFLDDGKEAEGNVLGRVDSFADYTETHDFFVGIGNNGIRERIMTRLTEGGANIVSLIHPNAAVGSHVTIGRGTVVMAGTVINTGAKIGMGVIINTASSVDHDCSLEDYVHISVGAHLAGTVAVGRGTMIGTGAAVINNLTIAGDTVIGAGAVVVKNILESGIYVGNPARLK